VNGQIGSATRPTARRVGDVAEGAALPSLRVTPTRVSVFLFGVAVWGAHRIHYDVEWARQEGYEDVLVQSPLISAHNVRLLTAWAGHERALVRLSERNVSPPLAGQELVFTGKVVRVGAVSGGVALVDIELLVQRTDGSPVVLGDATVQLSA
jgi:hydroxyacyl-ACP dehydratase HTD2-like protein with hotdog domain